MSSLFLFPSDSTAAPGAASIIETLESSSFIGSRISERDHLVGDKFLNYMTFVGCSPYVRLEPTTEGTGEFCHISILGPFQTPRLFVARNHTRPRCPRCKHRPTDWKARLPQWQVNPAQEWLCENCNISLSPISLDWRQYGAWGRVLVEIHHIYPGEAIPAESILESLQNTTGNSWLFGWADSV